MTSFPRATTQARSFGKYTLVAKIATGGMAEILLARLHGVAGFEKLVCIKRILPHLAEDQQFVSMFLDEARIAALISHPNVCQVFELGELEGSFFIAMEYLEGVPVALFRHTDVLPSPPDPVLVAGIGVQACEGLHHAHQLTRPDGTPLEVVHRDISGQNLFVTIDGTVKVLDFGIAKIQDPSMRTATGAMKGTYAYMAPEQIRGKHVDRRADVFALGIVLWETLAQRHLFRRDTEFNTFQAITSDPIPDLEALRPDLPPMFAQAIHRALARDPAERFQTARAFGEAIAKSMYALGGPAPASVIGEQITRTFHKVLAEQRSLVKLARDGGTLDLVAASGPAARYQSSLATPTSHIAGVQAPVITGTAPPSLATHHTRGGLGLSRWLVIGATALALGGGGAYAIVSRDAPKEAAAERVTLATTADAQAVAVPAPVTPTNVTATPPVESPLAGSGSGSASPAEPSTGSGDAPTSPEEPPATPGSAAETGGQVPRPPPRGSGQQAPAAPGFLTIDSSPVYSTIFVDGKPYGDTPLIRLQLPSGKHTVRAVNPSGQRRDVRITIAPGAVAVHRIEW